MSRARRTNAQLDNRSWMGGSGTQSLTPEQINSPNVLSTPWAAGGIPAFARSETTPTSVNTSGSNNTSAGWGSTAAPVQTSGWVTTPAVTPQSSAQQWGSGSPSMTTQPPSGSPSMTTQPPSGSPSMTTQPPSGTLPDHLAAAAWGTVPQPNWNTNIQPTWGSGAPATTSQPASRSTYNATRDRVSSMGMTSSGDVGYVPTNMSQPLTAPGGASKSRHVTINPHIPITTVERQVVIAGNVGQPGSRTSSQSATPPVSGQTSTWENQTSVSQQSGAWGSGVPSATWGAGAQSGAWGSGVAPVPASRDLVGVWGSGVASNSTVEKLLSPGSNIPEPPRRPPRQDGWGAATPVGAMSQPLPSTGPWSTEILPAFARRNVPAAEQNSFVRSMAKQMSPSGSSSGYGSGINSPINYEMPENWHKRIVPLPDLWTPGVTGHEFPATLGGIAPTGVAEAVPTMEETTGMDQRPNVLGQLNLKKTKEEPTRMVMPEFYVEPQNKNDGKWAAVRTKMARVREGISRATESKPDVCYDLPNLHGLLSPWDYEMCLSIYENNQLYYLHNSQWLHQSPAVYLEQLDRLEIWFAGIIENPPAAPGPPIIITPKQRNKASKARLLEEENYLTRKHEYDDWRDRTAHSIEHGHSVHCIDEIAAVLTPLSTSVLRYINNWFVYHLRTTQ